MDSELSARVRSFWRGFRRPEELAAEMDEEMRFHVEMEAERLRLDRRLELDEARRQGAIAFGGVEKRKEVELILPSRTPRPDPAFSMSRSWSMRGAAASSAGPWGHI